MARGGGHHSSHHGGHHSSHHSHHHVRHHYGRYGRYRSRRSELFTALLVAVYICIFFAGTILNHLPSRRALFERARTPLAAGSVIETGYYMDSVGGEADADVLLPGMKYFYEQTGVQPFVYFTKDYSYYSDAYVDAGDAKDQLIDTSQYSSSMERLEALYDALFEDEGHFLLVVQVDGSGSTAEKDISYYYGSKVDRIMDDAAIDIFFDYYDYYIDTSSTIDVISISFKKTADSVMGKTAGRFRVVYWLLVCAATAVIIVVVLKKYRDQQAEKKLQEFAKENGAKDSILYEDLVLDEPVKVTRTSGTQNYTKKQSSDADSTISWEEALQDMGLADEKLAHLESVEELENQPKKVDDFWKQSDVDWGFSLDEGIDLFKDEKK